jgi:EmrB/QacA subfamily drug resistance transporter
MEKEKITAVVLSVGIGTFMSSLDSSVVSLIMPMIKGDYGISLSMTEWIVTAYLLVVSSLLLTFGRIADLYGYKRVYTTGFIVFIAGSLLCGVSVNIAMLIVSRVIQAIGAGMLFSTGPAIITNTVPPERRGKALSVTAISVALGLCSGPVIGGTLSTLLGWQSVFFINLPIGLFGLHLVRKNIPQDKETNYVPFDLAGSILIFAALLLILLPLNISGDYAIPPALFAASIAAGLILILIFSFHEFRCKHPLFHMQLFKNRVFTASNASAFFTYMAQFFMVFLAPFYLESLRGYSALFSGLLYLPMPLATMCTAPISGGLSDRYGSRYLSAAGALIMSVGLLMLSFLGTGTSSLYIILSMIVTGFGFGIFQTPNNSAIMGNVSPQNRGIASGTLATMRNSGMVMGVAVSGALFSFLETRAMGRFEHLGRTGSLLHSSAFVFALHDTFLTAAAVALLAMTASLLKGGGKEGSHLAATRIPH